tara:strand:+ start:145 stop:426 length:282 start_codon:yes stop_codon:yes gene_type:complete
VPRGARDCGLRLFHVLSRRGRASLAELNLVRDAQANVAATDPNSYLIGTDPFALHSDDLHFNTEGQIALGEAFADSYVVIGDRPRFDGRKEKD